jgi:uncharacterized protein DUF3999
MIRRSLASFFLIVLLGAAAVATDLPTPWRSWRYSRSFEDVPRNERTPVTMLLPLDLLAHDDARSSDLRIIDDRGQEVPYFLTVLQSESKTETLPSHILERSFVVGQFTQVVVRVTDRPPRDGSHGATLRQLQAEPWFNTYRISTPETDFMFWVETSVSDDAHQWRVIDAPSPISRFRKRGLEGNHSIQFEGYSNQRYLRLRIFDPDRQFPVDDVEVLSCSGSEPPRIALPNAFSQEKSTDGTESRWATDLGTPNLPVSELDVSTDQPEFYRAIRISTSDDGKEWSFRAAGEIYRFHQSGKLKESLRINVPEAFARFWRVDIVDGNDRPLSNVRLELRSTERRVTFRAEPARTYRLIYGNDRASSPQYDLARVFGDKKVLPVVKLASEEATTNYADPRPFTERHPNLLWLALGIAVVVLAYAALRALRTPGPSAS